MSDTVCDGKPVGRVPYGGTTGQVLKKASSGDFVLEWGAAGSGGAAWGDVTGTLSAQVDLQTALDAKSATSHNHDAEYEALGHTHPASEISDSTATGRSLLTAADAAAARTTLDASQSTHTHNGLAPSGGTTGQVLKKSSNTNYDYAWAADSEGAGGAPAWGDITGTLSNQTDLQTALDAKAASSHTHALSDITDEGSLASKSSIATGDIDADAVTYAKLQNASATARILARKTAGAGDYEECTASEILNFLASVADGDIIYRTGGAWVRLAKGTAGQVLTMNSGATAPEWASAGGGADPWTYQVLTADFTTSSTTVADVTQGELLGFTPVANTKYIFEAQLMLRTATATVNPRVGFAWSTGLTDGVVQINTAQTATTQLTTFGNIGAAVLSAVGGLPNTTQSWPSFLWGMIVAGASPSGNSRVQLSTETAGTVVRVVAGSWLRYRSYT